MRAWPRPPPVPPACSLGAAVLLGVRRPCEQTQLSGGPGASQASLEQRGVGAEGGRFRDVRSGRFLDGHFFLCSFTQSLHMEPLLRVVVQGIWDPGEKMGSAPVPVESLASLAPQGHLFVYPQGPQI